MFLREKIGHRRAIASGQWVTRRIARAHPVSARSVRQLSTAAAGVTTSPALDAVRRRRLDMTSSRQGERPVAPGLFDSKE